MRVVILTVCIFYLVQHSDAAAEHFNWAYGSTLGPKYWKDTYKMCGGTHQSPINIVTKDAKYDASLKPFEIKLDGTTKSSYEIENLGLNFRLHFGSTVWKATFPGSSNHCYQLLQMHYHWGSGNSAGGEHTIDGKKYPIEVHYVMWNCEYYSNPSEAAGSVNGLAVIGYFYEVDNSITPNPTLQSIVNALKSPSIKQCPCYNHTDVATVSVPYFDVNNLLPTNPSDKKVFYRYKGSLTTPPCTENVLWTVHKTPLKITDAQLSAFRGLLNRKAENGGITKMVDNYRPVLPLNPKSPSNSLRFVSTSDGVPLSNSLNMAALSALSITTLASLITNYF